MSAVAEVEANGKATISKVDSVRRALDALGRDAKPAAIVEYVKATYDVEITPAMASTYKGQTLHPKPKNGGAEESGDAAPKPRGRPRKSVDVTDAPLSGLIATVPAAPEPVNLIPTIRNEVVATSAIVEPLTSAPCVVAPSSSAALPANVAGDPGMFRLDDLKTVKAMISQIGAEKMRVLMEALS